MGSQADALVALLQGSPFATPALSLLVLCGAVPLSKAWRASARMLIDRGWPTRAGGLRDALALREASGDQLAEV